MHKSEANKKKNLPSTSTPNTVFLSARKSIHHDESISPIIALDNLESKTPTKYYTSALAKVNAELQSDGTESDSSLDGDFTNSGRSNIEDYSNYQNDSRKSISRTADNTCSAVKNVSSEIPKNGYIFVAILLIIAIAVALGLTNVDRLQSVATAPKTITIDDLRNCYPMQLTDTWTALISGIDEVKTFKKPSVFLLLYENDAEETVNHMLTNITRYASSILSGNYEVRPIMLKSSDLSTADVRADYGRVIKKYKPQLERVGIMVVKNLDEVPGEVAQAFHSMCDEYTPLVAKTAFFFTIKVESLSHSYKTDLDLVERTLRNNWIGLNDDIFYPLFTRISSMVLRVVPEKL